jgi:hypothetical protein
MIDETLIKTYAEKNRQDPDQLREWIAAETWMTAEQAVERASPTRSPVLKRAETGRRRRTAHSPGISARIPAHRSNSVINAITGRLHRLKILSTGITSCGGSKSHSFDALPRAVPEPP